jgi:hypothetical protein
MCRLSALSDAFTFNRLGGGLTSRGGAPSFFVTAGQGCRFKWVRAAIDGGLLDKLVFGVGVRSHLKT